ncbi:MAG: hypothetical protein AAGB34_06385 [Planctomycetota bacterium]
MGDRSFVGSKRMWRELRSLVTALFVVGLLVVLVWVSFLSGVRRDPPRTLFLSQVKWWGIAMIEYSEGEGDGVLMPSDGLIGLMAARDLQEDQTAWEDIWFSVDSPRQDGATKKTSSDFITNPALHGAVFDELDKPIETIAVINAYSYFVNVKDGFRWDRTHSIYVAYPDGSASGLYPHEVEELLALPINAELRQLLKEWES